MAYGLVAQVSARSTDTNGFTTGAIDTSGATLLVLAVSYLNGTTPAISDSKGNTWTALTPRENGGASSIRLYYAANPVVGSGHTFTVAVTAGYPALSVGVFSNALTVSPFDQQNGTVSSGASSLAPGSVTPTEDNELLVAAVGCNSNPSSIDLGFTTLGLENGSGNNFGCGLAYLVQTSAAAANPTWTIAASTNLAVAIATFKAAPATANGRMFMVL